MNNIYDNGYKMLGQNIKLKEYFNKMLESGLDDLEEEYCRETLKELDDYADDDILMLDYDYGMGAYICAWTSENIVKESE
jgi:hypothetical protein